MKSDVIGLGLNTIIAGDRNIVIDNNTSINLGSGNIIIGNNIAEDTPTYQIIIGGENIDGIKLGFLKISTSSSSNILTFTVGNKKAVLNLT
jgi:hypothetical protein